MKNIIYSILVCLPFVFGACDKSTDDTSKVTYFVTLEREGDEKIVLEKGQPFVEPGYYAVHFRIISRLHKGLPFF